MPRMPRFIEPNQICHLTHRCHNRTHLLRFVWSRRCYRWWLWEGVRRYRVSVLAWNITCNHVHLVVHAPQPRNISRLMQLVEGRVAQVYNCRKQRRGAFWSDRFHVTLVESGEHLSRCLAYVDLNMVRAGAVSHPAEWPWSSFAELRNGRKRHVVLDRQALLRAFNCPDLDTFLGVQRRAVDAALDDGLLRRDPVWTEAVAVGSEEYVCRVARRAARFRPAMIRPEMIVDGSGGWILRESTGTYGSLSRRNGGYKPDPTPEMQLTTCG